MAQTYTLDDIYKGGSGKLLGVRILPVLAPNPAATATDGAYTIDDLANITADNYNQYFLRQPGSAYTADLTPQVIRVNYMASGQYFVEIRALVGDRLVTKVFHDQMDDFFIQDRPKAAKDKAGVSRKIPVPSAEL